MAWICSYCEAHAVRSWLINVGHKPAEVRKQTTQADDRKIVVVRACLAHAGKAARP